MRSSLEFYACVVEDHSELSDDEYAALSDAEKELGCRSYGAGPGEAPATATAVCTVFPEIECLGEHTFKRPQTPCIKCACPCLCSRVTDAASA